MVGGKDPIPLDIIDRVVGLVGPDKPTLVSLTLVDDGVREFARRELFRTVTCRGGLADASIVRFIEDFVGNHPAAARWVRVLRITKHGAAKAMRLNWCCISVLNNAMPILTYLDISHAIWLPCTDILFKSSDGVERHSCDLPQLVRRFTRIRISDVVTERGGDPYEILRVASSIGELCMHRISTECDPGQENIPSPHCTRQTIQQFTTDLYRDWMRISGTVMRIPQLRAVSCLRLADIRPNRLSVARGLCSGIQDNLVDLTLQFSYWTATADANPPWVNFDIGSCTNLRILRLSLPCCRFSLGSDQRLTGTLSTVSRTLAVIAISFWYAPSLEEHVAEHTVAFDWRAIGSTLATRCAPNIVILQLPLLVDTWLHARTSRHWDPEDNRWPGVVDTFMTGFNGCRASDRPQIRLPGALEPVLRLTEGL